MSALFQWSSARVCPRLGPGVPPLPGLFIGLFIGLFTGGSGRSKESESTQDANRRAALCATAQCESANVASSDSPL